MKITIDTDGNADKDLILAALKSKNIQQIVDAKTDLKIQEIVNQYFNKDIITQNCREQFKQTLSRLIVEHTFDAVFNELLKEAIGKYLNDKNVEHIIKQAAKEHITTIVQKLKSI